MAIGGLTERLAILITADSKGAVREFGRVGDAADKNLGKAQQRMDRVGGTLTKVGGAMLSVGALAAVGLKQAGDAASELEQSVGGIESVFGDAAGIIKDFGRTADQSAGLSQRAVNQMAAKIGASLKGMGFEAREAAETVVELEKRAADMAATFGGTTEQAIDSVAAALRGERDPIERFGVSIKQVDVNARIAALGLDTATAAATKNAQAVATLDLIMEQTSDAAGQFARESDTAAGAQARMTAAMENAKATIGQAVLPIMAALADKVSDAASAFNDLDPATKETLSRIAVIGTVATTAVGGLSLLAGQAIKMRGRFTDATGSLTAFGHAAKGVAVVGVAALAGELGKIATGAVRRFFDDAPTDIERLRNGLVDLASTGRALGEVSRVLGDDLGEFGDALQTALSPGVGERARDAFSTLINFGDKSAGTIDRARQKIDEVDKSLAELARSGHADVARDAFGDLALAAINAGIGTDDLRALLDDYATAVGSVETESKLAAKATDELGDEMGETGEETLTAAEAFSEFEKSLKAAFDPLFDLQSALVDHADAQRAVNESYEEFGPQSDAARKAELDLARATLDLTTAVGRLDVAVRDGSVSLSSAKQTLQAWVAAGLITQAQADSIAGSFEALKARADELDGTVAEIKVTADVSDAQRKLDEFLRKSFGPGVSLGAALNISTAEGRQHGGAMTPGHPYVVGEKRPELIIPSTVASVQPTTTGVGGGGLVVQHLEVRGSSDPEHSALATMRRLRQMTFLLGV